jgi:hypothetical protein
MNASPKFTTLLSVGMAGLALWAAGLTSANARPPFSGGSTVTRTGLAGNTSTRRSTITTNGQGGYSAGSTFAGPAGNVTTRSQSGSYNAATRTYSRSGATTYPNGRQSGFTSSTQATGDGYVHSATHTGINGNTVSTQGQATYNPSTGTVDQSRTTTGPGGHSTTENRTIQVGAP